MVGRKEAQSGKAEGMLKECFETCKNDPFKDADCEACLSAKTTRHPKSGDAPKLGGGSEGLGLEVDITGPFSTSMDGYEHLFVGIERSSHVLFAIPIKQKSEAHDVMLASIAKLERQLGLECE